jgi:hypothetical protein
MSAPVLAVHDWPTNGALIADVARLYLDKGDRILDATYGRGRWWTEWSPDRLVTNDLNPATNAEFHTDFRAMPFPSNEFDVVAFDPPYKLNGTPVLGDFDQAYGIAQPTRWQDRMELIRDGFLECLRVADRLVLAKCQDQVVSGRMRWQTFMLMEAAAGRARLVDRFDMLGGTRKQPSGRRQVHARGRGSSLLVFEVSALEGSK